MRQLATLFFITMVIQTSSAADRTHHTFRYFTDGGKPQRFQTMAFSSDSNQLAISIGGKVEFISLDPVRIIRRFRANPFTVRYSRDDSRVYMIGRTADYLLGTKSWEQLKTTRERVPGFVGLTLTKVAGKLLINSVVPGGPTAKTSIKVGDELIGLGEGRNGKMNVVAGKSVEYVYEVLKGPVGTFVKLKVLPKGSFGERNATEAILQRHSLKLVDNRFRFGTTPSEINENLAWCISKTTHTRQEFRDASTGKPLVQFATIDVRDEGLVSVSPDQQRFAIIAKQKSSGGTGVEVFDILSRSRLAFVPMSSVSFYSISFSADASRVLIATEKGVDIIDVATRGVVAKLTPGTAIATPFSFDEPNPGAEAVATALNEVDDGTWRADRSRVVTELAVSSDDIVATADVSGSLILWDLESRSVLERLSEEENSTPDSLQFSPNGKWLAYYLSGVLHVIDVKDIASREKPPAAALKSNSPELIRNPADIPGLEIVEQIESFVPRIGLRVDVRSRGRWFPATIVGAYGSGLWQIHYDDSPDDWDEVVTNRRLRVRPAR